MMIYDGTEHVFVLCSCSCLDVGCVCGHVCVRLNRCCAHIPVRAEHLFVFGQWCSLPAPGDRNNEKALKQSDTKYKMDLEATCKVTGLPAWDFFDFMW